MSQEIFATSAPSFAAAMGSLAEILAKAAGRADAAELPSARLAPDMLPLSTQVRLVCFHASNGTARLMGREVSGRPSTEDADIATLIALLNETAAKLGALTAADFAGAAARQIVMQLQPPMQLEIDGANFLNRWLLPNFYFHLVTAYDILRHKGLAIGKRDYMSHLAPFMHEVA